MLRTIILAAISSLCALALAACDSSSGDDETEPTFEQAQGIAEEQLADAGCEFQVEDESTDDLEQMTLNCLVVEGGQEQLFTVLNYSRDLEVTETDSLIGGLTTSDQYFENGNITVEPSGTDPTAPQLDAEDYVAALIEDCDCGEAVTPSS